MPVTSEWMQRNVGMAGADARIHPAAAAADEADDRTWRRELIDFDSEGASGAAFQAQATLASIGLSHFANIVWPKDLEPIPGGRPADGPLPEADVLIVTWTMDEGHALSRVLTPPYDSSRDWVPYTKNFASISAMMRPGCPARDYGRLGTFWTCRIGGKRVTLFKSDSHMSQDGPRLANAVVWRQIIDDCHPTWVITTGTGGGIGPEAEVGDVIVSRFVSFDCRREFATFNGQSFACAHTAPDERFTEARRLFAANAGLLPKDNARAPRIVVATSPTTGVLTTDFFGFDDTANTFQLQGKGDLSEMGDAVLGLVCAQLGAAAPSFVCVRNVSDPQIASGTMTIPEQEQFAAHIYEAFGLWSTVCSAITCWAIVAAL